MKDGAEILKVGQWKQLSLQKKRLGKKSHSEVLAACSTDPKAVLTVLNEKNISEHLSWEQFLEILGCNHQLSLQILRDQDLEFDKELSADDLVILGKMHHKIAKHILDTPLLCDKLNKTKLLSLGKSHVEVAMHLLHSEALCKKIEIGKNELLELGKQFPDIAIFILESDTLSRKLEKKDKFSLGKQLPAVARYMLDNVPEQLDKEAVSAFAASLPEIAMHIIDRSELTFKLSAYDLGKFGDYCANIPFIVFNDPELSCKFGSNLEALNKKRTFITRVFKAAEAIEQPKQIPEWVDIINKDRLFEKSDYSQLKKACLREPEGVFCLLNDEGLRKSLLSRLSWQQFLEIIGCNSKFLIDIIKQADKPGLVPLSQLLNVDDLMTLGKMHHNIAASILSHTELKKKLSVQHWMSFGEQFEKIAHFIIDKKPEPFKELSKGDLCKLAKAHVSVANAILENPDLCNQLEKRDWLDLIKNNHKIARLIFERPDIYATFEQNDWRTLAKHCQKIAMQIATNKDLKDQLNKDDLCNLGKRFSDVGRYVLSTPALHKELEGRDLYNLGENFPPIVGLISKNRALKTKLSKFGSQPLEFKGTFIEEVSERIKPGQ